MAFNFFFSPSCTEGEGEGEPFRLLPRLEGGGDRALTFDDTGPASSSEELSDRAYCRRRKLGEFPLWLGMVIGPRPLETRLDGSAGFSVS
jgi:hypothetical protein